MKHADSLKIVGQKVILVPYRVSHVEKYHQWMSDEEILRLTSSERLSLEDEFKMQNTWSEDKDKCTFIILEKSIYEATLDENKAMVGDTNLFLIEDIEVGVGEEENVKSAEIEIMIAEPEARRKGIATEALELMMNYGMNSLNLISFIAKIKGDNLSSINLFKKLGFIEKSYSKVFEEITLEFSKN